MLNPFFHSYNMQKGGEPLHSHKRRVTFSTRNLKRYQKIKKKWLLMYFVNIFNDMYLFTCINFHKTTATTYPWFQYKLF